MRAQALGLEARSKLRGPENWGTVKAIVFDLDGTLLDSREQIGVATNLVRVRLGLSEASEEDLASWFGMKPEKFFSELGLQAKESAVALFRNELLNSPVPCPAFADVAPTLSLLKKLNITMLVATTKPTWLAEHVLHQAGIATYFQHIQGTDGFPAKPEPNVFLECLRNVQLEPSLEVIAIGDRLEDAIGAKGAGLVPIGLIRAVTDPPHEEFIEVGAVATIRSLEGLLSFSDWNEI